MTKQIQIALLVAASFFMEMLDGTIITTALPKMAVDFNTNLSTITLMISTYLVAVAVSIPLCGWLAQRYGKKRIWIIAVLIFTLSSLGSAMSPNLGILLVMRLLQGFSGALMTPTGQLIVLQNTPPQQMLRMTSYLVWPSLIAPAIAPVIGGLIVTYWSWHWIFLINIPIGLIIAGLGVFVMENDDQDRKQIPFDFVGFIEVGLASILLLVGAELATHGPVLMIVGLILVVLGIVFGWMVYRHLRTVSNPLFSVDAVKFPSFRIYQTGGSVFWITVAAMPYVMTMLLQTIFNWSAAKTGWYIIFIFIGNIGIKPFTSWIINKLQFRGALLLSFWASIISSVCLAIIGPNTFGPWIMFLALISGCGRSLALTAYNGINLIDIEPKERPSANTLIAVTRSLAQGLGISLITVVINLFEQVVSNQMAFTLSFLFLALITVYPLIEVWVLPHDIGKEALTK